jgi:hypothetical protein
MSDLDTLERYRKALLQVIDLGDGCMCDRHGGCGCGCAAANIARDALNPPKRAKPAPRQASTRNTPSTSSNTREGWAG